MTTDRRAPRTRRGWRGRILGSARARILIGALTLLAATLAVSIVADRALLLSQLADRIDDQLAQEVAEFQRLAEGIDPESGEAFGADVTAIFDTFFARNIPDADEVFLGLVDGQPYVRTADAPYPVEREASLVRAWGAATEPSYGTTSTGGGELRWLVVPVFVVGQDEPAGTFVVARFPAGERSEVDDAIRAAAIVGIIAFLAATAAAWALAGRVLSPLRDLATAAASVREDNLDQRIPVEGSGELADLTRTFNAMLDRVEGAFESQRAFLDDAGHELRTPITVIRGHLELADADEPLGATTREVVFDELDRMTRIVEDLLLIAKAERPDFVEPGPVDVADLTHEIAAKARPLVPRDWQVRANAVVVAELDRERITQAWMNLVRNAVQHTVDDQRIEVFSVVVGDHLELGVSDQGEGVASEDRARIFERFSRGASARRTRSDGAGLGLAIAQAIASAHGGTVELRDTPGGGATFVLSLPAASVADPEPPPTEPSPEDVPWPAS
jgi:signal transduction histidine kinase